MSKNEMIMLPREVVERALDALTRGCPPDCKDGMTDSGGVHPWGEAALIECPSCQAVEALRAALEQPDAGPTATTPAGWKLVPVEPTRGMLDAAHKDLVRDAEIDMMLKGIHSAMLAAAPQPPKHYDQQALDLCMTCGWKTMIPGDCCLNCARQKPQVEQEPAAWRCCPPGECSYRQLHRTDSCPREDLPAAPQLPVVEQPQGEQEPVASLADAIRAEPTELIRKWRVLELIKDHTRPQPKPLTDEAVLGVAKSIEIQFDSERLNEQIDDILAFARAIERAHGIGGDL